MKIDMYTFIQQFTFFNSTSLLSDANLMLNKTR